LSAPVGIGGFGALLEGACGELVTLVPLTVLGPKFGPLVPFGGAFGPIFGPLGPTFGPLHPAFGAFPIFGPPGPT